MAGFKGDDRGRAEMFQDGNRIRFERPVDEVARQWWMRAFLEPFGLTPEAMGDLLTRSVVSDKTIIYRTIDGYEHSFKLRIEGRFHDHGEVWFVERSLHLDGPVFSADQMFIPLDDAQEGRGRLMMADLMRTCGLLGISRISIEAERIGRYAWLLMGFVPDRGSWRNIQMEALRFVQRHQASLGAEAQKLLEMISGGGPGTARWLAGYRLAVPSRELFDEFGHPIPVPFGKAFFLEAAPNWTGEFNFDPESNRLARAYVDRVRGEGSDG